MNKKKVCAILAALCLSVGICMPVSAAGNPNVTVFEAEAGSFYIPPRMPSFSTTATGTSPFPV